MHFKLDFFPVGISLNVLVELHVMGIIKPRKQTSDARCVDEELMF